MSEFLEAVPELQGQAGAEINLPAVEGMRAEVWALAWPVILSFALDSILGLAAMLMVGRLGAEAVGAVGLATQILGAVRAGIAAVGTGTIALVARYIGANDRDNAEEVLKQSVVWGVIVSTAIAIPVIVFAVRDTKGQRGGFPAVRSNGRLGASSRDSHHRWGTQ